MKLKKMGRKIRKTQSNFSRIPHPVPGRFSGNLIPGITLFILVFVFYFPALKAGFIWDDEAITQNPLLTSFDGLLKIWCKPWLLPLEAHYWPMIYTTFWIEYQIWGLHPLGYHFVNVILHSLNVILLWWILRNNFVPGSWLVAAVFALHPVHVESVAWVIERKDVLSGFFYLLSFICYTKFSKSNKAGFYILSLLLFICAMLSKSIVVTLPFALLLWLWWKDKPLTKKTILSLTPFLLISLILVTVDLWLFKHRTTAKFDFSFLERCLIAGKAIWFYLWKIIFPFSLMPIYPRWAIKSARVWEYLFPLFAVCLPIVLFLLRKRIGKSPAVLVLFFEITLTPVLGFLDFGFMSYSFVADRFQYIASIGVILLLTSGMVYHIRRIFPHIHRWILYFGGGFFLLLLGVLTWNQSALYKDYETLFRYNVKKNPRSWAAHNNLATALEKKGEIDEAIKHYLKGVEIKPHEAQIYYNLGAIFTKKGQMDKAIAYYQQAIRLKPDFAEAHNNLGLIFASQGDSEKAFHHYTRALEINPYHIRAHFNLGNLLLQKGDILGAIKHYEKVVEINPRWTEAANNLAWILATTPSPEFRDAEQAIFYAEIACKNTSYNEPSILDTLAAAYAEAGRFNQAIAIAKKAIEIAETTGCDKKIIQAMQHRLELYKAGQPFHESTR